MPQTQQLSDSRISRRSLFHPAITVEWDFRHIQAAFPEFLHQIQFWTIYSKIFEKIIQLFAKRKCFIRIKSVLILILKPLKSEFHLGKKYIYLTEEGYIAFELLQYISKSIAARKIQKYWWKHRERRNRAAVTIQECKDKIRELSKWHLFDVSRNVKSFITP